YSILLSKQKTLYVGTYNGLCYLDSRSGTFKTIPLPVRFKKNSLLVNSLLEDTIRKCIWIGTEGYLFKFFPASGLVERIDYFDDNSIKSLAIDRDQNLLCGTDNGLYIYNGEKKIIKHLVHDSRNGKSLTNNIVWSVFVDKNNNAWFGTDYGVSLYKYTNTYKYIPISHVTGIGDGNQLQAIYKDSRNNFWYGGTNGLIFTSPGNKTCLWYKLGDKQYPISHNRIRSIYEDSDKNLWVATDGSINRYDYQTRQFIHYNIVDSTRTRNANWAYSLFEDKQGRLWIGTCLGGIFVVNKEKLMKSKSSFYVAEQNFYKKPGKYGLSDNFINKILPDRQGNVWALTYNNGINKINTKTGMVTRFSVHVKAGQKSNINATCLICDREGYIWIGFVGGINRIDPKTNRTQEIRYKNMDESVIRVLTEEKNHIWITTSDGTFVLDKKTLSIKHVKIANIPLWCSFYDSSVNEIYLGGIDGFVVFSTNIIKNENHYKPIILTALYVNDVYFQAGVDYKGKSIPYSKEISLNYNQNNVSFEFSDLSFSQEEIYKYVYQLEGVDNDWRTVKSGSNRISYNNLAPGNYKLSIGRLDSEGKTVQSLLNFNLIIRPPWYYSLWAKLFYALLIIGFFLWVFNYFRDKHRTKIERIEKEKSLELSNLKIEFFTNVSHEFKTPLSLIIAPISKLLIETKNLNLKKQLNQIQQNALRLNALIQQVISFERFDGSMNNTLIISQVEFIEFARGIFSVYEEAFSRKNLTASFITEMEAVLVTVDVLKMESVLNNLISNALKFSNTGGTINFEIHRSSENDSLLVVNISDSGIGIPSGDLPFIFDRFFQSRKTVNDKVGSGIGLYLVKNYVELHKGTVSISSEEDKGTKITLLLPVIENHAITGSLVKADDEDSGTLGIIHKPLVLIVEDNLEVSEFIQQALSSNYKCTIAHNGKTGLDLAIKIKPELIISDVMMPVMDGLEMCKQLRKNKDLSLVPIIMLTAKDDKLTESDSIAIGINAFMSKPFDTSLLLLRMKQLLGTKEKIEEKLRLEALTDPKEIVAESWTEKILVDITRIIEDKIADADLNVNSLSRISGISTKQIYRRIKQLTGLSPVEYIRSIRMKKAAMLLTQQKFSVAEVMYMVGFSSASYFSKCFHNQFGMTPKQFIDSTPSAL
ncbi:MAG: two-component regulator propeller domain-containing protein, partial [Paludibacter sp.]